jgi:hypothetical protein
MDRTPPTSIKLIVEALHGVVDPSGTLYYDWAAIALAKLAPTVGALPAALQDDELCRRASGPL